MDTIVNPFKQASIGLVKGVSSFPGNVAKSVSKIGDGLAIVSDSVVENAGKIFRTNANVRPTIDIQTFPIVEETQTDVKTKKGEETKIFHRHFRFRIQKIFHYEFCWSLWTKFSI